MVGRLIENKQVGIDKQELGQFNTDAPAPAEFNQPTGEVRFGKTQSGEYNPGFVFSIIAAGRLEGMLHLTQFMQQNSGIIFVLLFGKLFL